MAAVSCVLCYWCSPSYICNATFQAEEDKNRWRRRTKMIHRRYSTYNPYTSIWQNLAKFNQLRPNQAEIIQRYTTHISIWRDQAETIHRCSDATAYFPNQVKRKLKPDQMKTIQAKIIPIPYYIESFFLPVKCLFSYTSSSRPHPFR